MRIMRTTFFKAFQKLALFSHLAYKRCIFRLLMAFSLAKEIVNQTEVILKQ